MVNANLDPSFELGKRLSGMEQRLKALETKLFPISAGTAKASANNFAIPSSSTQVVSLQMAIPQGFTSALVMVTGSAFLSAQINGESYDWAAAQILMSAPNGQTANSAWSGLGGTSNGSGMPVSPNPLVAQWPSVSAYFTGLSAGAKISIGMNVWSGIGWPSSVANNAFLNAMAIYLL